MLASRHRSVAAVLGLMFVGTASAALGGLLPTNVARYLEPTVASVLVFAAFSLALYRKAGDDIFAELGFLYVGIIMAYTVIPAAGFSLSELDPANPLGQLFPDPTRINLQLWRHVLFQASVAAGYLLLRGRLPSPIVVRSPNRERDLRTILVVAALIAACVGVTILTSAPVESYYDHYVRYNELPWLEHKLVSLTVRLSLGLYCVLLVFLFRSYRRYRLVIPVVVLVICAHEVVYSFGARIQALIVLLQAVCLYHYMVKRISLKAGFVAFMLLGALFSAVEVVRQFGGDVQEAKSIVADEGFRPASEFGAVFFPGYHLYEERAHGALPPREWPMFFNDAVSLVTFGDFTRWNPMAWYASNYYPEAEVAPFTMGPIADSAMWGGELDLLIRGLANGLFFAYIMRWFVRHRDRWWGLSVYVYCYATCILTLKYSVFLDLSLIEKNLLPTLLLVHIVRVSRYSARRWKAAATGLAAAP